MNTIFNNPLDAIGSGGHLSTEQSGSALLEAQNLLESDSICSCLRLEKPLRSLRWTHQTLVFS